AESKLNSCVRLTVNRLPRAFKLRGDAPLTHANGKRPNGSVISFSAGVPRYGSAPSHAGTGYGSDTLMGGKRGSANHRSTQAWSQSDAYLAATAARRPIARPYRDVTAGPKAQPDRPTRRSRRDT